MGTKKLAGDKVRNHLRATIHAYDYSTLCLL